MSRVSTKNEVMGKKRHVVTWLGRVIPARCQLCGQWGFPHAGHEWICDACLIQIFSQVSTKPTSYRHPKYNPESPEA